MIVFHDYVYQHYLADQCVSRVKSVSSFGALLLKFGPRSALRTLRNSRITSRLERPIYSPWDTDYASQVPLSSPFAKMGSAAIVHSRYAEDEVRRHFSGPLLRLGMPFDQKPTVSRQDGELWAERVAGATQFKALFFGHINPTKSLDLVLEAIADSEYLRGHLKLTIAGFAGSQDYLKRLTTLTAIHRLDSVVTFELNVSDSRLRDLSNSTDIFINLRFPNTEGASVSLVEQMIVGKPVLIYDTGCYADVPDDAALKVDVVGNTDEIRLTLEQALVDTGRLISIGQEARKHVSKLSCDDYVRQILDFVTQHRALLQDRTKLGSIQRVAAPRESLTVKAEESEWLGGLAEARLSFDFLDKGLAPVDPALIFGFTAVELAEYIAVSIIGAPTLDNLIQALVNYVKTVPRALAYWDIDYLRLLTAAIFDGSPNAFERLRHLAPVARLDLWHILSELPPKAFHRAACLMLTGHPLDADSAAEVELGIEAGLPVQLLLAAQSGLMPDSPRIGSGFDDLSWLHSMPIDVSVRLDVPASEGPIDLNDPSQVMLIGTYAQEETGVVWTRGRVSFIVCGAGAGDRVNLAFRTLTAGVGPRRVCIYELGCQPGFETVVMNDDVHWACVELAKRSTVDSADDPAIIVIQVDSSIRPCDVGLGEDGRQLGIHLITLNLDPAKTVKLLDLAVGG